MTPSDLQKDYINLLDTKNNLVDLIQANIRRGIHSSEFAQNIFEALDTKIYATHITILNKNIDGFIALKNDFLQLSNQYKIDFCQQDNT